ncbi:5451_t:CDS:2 [Ambispora gerdemannii]|uniref:Tubulin-specific chaperone A n=1 Tax=Ambispora gerdemannii TaxID=144530 RepID=A0A9N9EW14_9GLOM|nr:5451_t:CDS:2 [Ambispora gerdemannii]
MSLRELKIQTGVVKRLYKEKQSYIKEREQQIQRIERITAEGADSYDIAKQNEVLEETLQMIPDTQTRLEAARRKLQGLIDNQGSSWAETEELRQATDILKDTTD